jgi:Dyp-type peroxidase family
MSTTKRPLFELDRPLTTADLTTYEAELSQLQANILKPHGRKAAVHLFLTFKRDKQNEARQFLRQTVVTSAAEQAAQKQRHSGSLLTVLFLSAKGYEYLGFPTEGFSQAFREGMQKATERLADPPPDQWESKYQKDLHAMLLWAHDSKDELISLARTNEDKVYDFAEASTESGSNMKDSQGKAIEHFGYRDGISQPVFFETDAPQTQENWNPSSGPNLVLTEVQLGAGKADWGSYYVFRKLEQNVRRFKEHERDLAGALNLTGDSRELAGAMVIGRFEDGTPVALSGVALGANTPANDFVYRDPETDPQGYRCPFSAHIRKTNPRGDPNGQTLDEQKSHRIARRGIPYGDPTLPGSHLEALPETGVGLLFQCYQANLAHQFEFLQRAWANNADMARPGTGIDPVIGQSSNGSIHDLRFPTRWGKPGGTLFSFHSVVTLKGGEYFFAPSISFLKSL